MHTGKNYETIIVGGGITGAAVAYALGAAGHGDALLLERNFPASGATAKAAAIISVARSVPETIPYVRETLRQIDSLAAGDPGSLGFSRVGAIHAASTPDGVETLDKTLGISRKCGVNGRELEPGRLRAELPWMREKTVAKACFYADESFVDAYLLTTAYLDAAKRLGARIAPMCPATGILPRSGRGYEVKTGRGSFHARNVVIAAGAWSNLLLESLGASIPFAPVRSQYWITGVDPELFPPRQPICILPDARVYTRPEHGSLVIGWREPECVYVDPRELPAEVFAHRFGRDPEGWENFEGCVRHLEPFFPAIADQGISRYVAGCSTYTPDGLFNVGEIPGFPGLYAAAGCSGMGVAACGGIGRAVAECVAEGVTGLPLGPFSPNRFGARDVFSREFMLSCASARSAKKTG
ncbi:MAG: FAD-binding oxidoreductase [Planctomycetota bacterium]|jgi:4-methylaminobutanoate oxidase (formaldehyde-forming)|nr:FAD-binding oxidoreductase [Planctomycetota bacterium]